MNKTWLFITGFFCLLAPLSGCQPDDRMPDRPEPEADVPMNAVFEVNLTVMDGNGRSRMAADSTPGNVAERRISTVQLFVVPLNDNGEEVWSGLRFGEATVLPEFKNPVTIPVAEFAFDRIHVYVGANMNREQTDAFIRSKNAYYEITREKYLTYYTAINQLAPFYPDWQTGSHRHPENIVMFATGVLSADRDLIEETVDEQTGETRKTIRLGTVTLKRTVAKVLLTCVATDGNDANSELHIAPGAKPGVMYVKTSNDLIGHSEGNPVSAGWIRQEDVYYFINNMPRRVKFPQEYEDRDMNGVKETLVPNYNLKNTIINELGLKFSPIKFNRDRMKDVYIHYDILELHKRNRSFQQSKVWNEAEYNRLTANLESEYSRDHVGMYTAENMFGVEDGDFSEDELRQMKGHQDLPFLTKIAIAAKFTPRFIFVTEKEWESGANGFEAIKDHKLNGKPLSQLATEVESGLYPGYLRLECSGEEVAQELLTYSLKMHGRYTDGDYDAENAPYVYPENTFFAYFRDDQILYSSYGVASVNNPKNENWQEMIPYTRGWSFYYTYINNEHPDPVERIEEICIERNIYYILKLTSIGTLGTSVGDNRYIEVHTLKSDWQDGGKGETIIH